MGDSKMVDTPYVIRDNNFKTEMIAIPSHISSSNGVFGLHPTPTSDVGKTHTGLGIASIRLENIVPFHINFFFASINFTFSIHGQEGAAVCGKVENRSWFPVPTCVSSSGLALAKLPPRLIQMRALIWIDSVVPIYYFYCVS